MATIIISSEVKLAILWITLLVCGVYSVLMAIEINSLTKRLNRDHPTPSKRKVLKADIMVGIFIELVMVIFVCVLVGLIRDV